MKRVPNAVVAARFAWSLVRRRLRGTPHVLLRDTKSRVVADLSTPLGLRLYRYREYTDCDFSVLRTYLREGGVFVDCGANVGMFTLSAASIVGENGRIVAFEPAPPARASLQANVGLNLLTQVTVLPYALADVDGNLELVVMGEGGGLSSFAPADARAGRTISVPVARLDDCLPSELRDRVDLIKIDVEGAELRALQGAVTILRRARPVLLVEVEDEHLRRQGASADELDRFLTSLDYSGTPTPGPSPNVLYVPNEKASLDGADAAF